MGARHPGANPHGAEATGCLLWVTNGCAGRSTGTSAGPQIADAYFALRKSAARGHFRKCPA